MREIWLAHLDKTRPVVVLTRAAACAAMSKVTVAPITSTVKGLSSEVSVGAANGLDHEGAIALVRSRRAELGLSERKLAELASVSRGYVSLLLKDRGSHKDDAGEYKLPNPTLDVVWRLADAPEVDVTYLVDDSRGIERTPERRAWR